MPQFLLALQMPDNFDPSTADAAMDHDIDVVNDEMAAAGIRVFMGGLYPPRQAKSVRMQPDGNQLITDGPYLETKEHVGGFWIIEAANMEEALVWARKGSRACRQPVEVREFQPMPTK